MKYFVVMFIAAISIEVGLLGKPFESAGISDFNYHELDYRDKKLNEQSLYDWSCFLGSISKHKDCCRLIDFRENNLSRLNFKEWQCFLEFLEIIPFRVEILLDDNDFSEEQKQEIEQHLFAT